MQERPPKPCRRRDCPAQAGRPRRRARWEALCHTADRDGATRRSLRAGIKKSIGRLRKEPLDVFASIRCSVDRASPSTTHEVSSNVVRVAGRLTGTGGSNPFSSTGDSYKPDHSDRSGAGRRGARETGECRWIGGNADDDHSQRNPPPCLPAPPSSLPSGGLPGRDLVTSANTGFAMHDGEGRQIGW